MAKKEEKLPIIAENEMKICIFCGEKFSPSHPQQEFCDMGCSTYGYTRIEIMKKYVLNLLPNERATNHFCPICKQQFYDSKFGIFDSEECQKKAHKLKHFAKSKGKTIGRALAEDKAELRGLGLLPEQKPKPKFIAKVEKEDLEPEDYEEEVEIE